MSVINCSQADREIIGLMQSQQIERSTVLELSHSGSCLSDLIRYSYSNTSLYTYESKCDKGILTYIDYLLSGNLQETFNYIILNGIMEYTRIPDRLIQECCRLLSDGGRLIIRIPNMMYYKVIFRILSGSLGLVTNHININKQEYLYTWNDAVSLFTGEGLEVEECVYTIGPDDVVNIPDEDFVKVMKMYKGNASRVMFQAYEYIFKLRLR